MSITMATATGQFMRADTSAVDGAVVFTPAVALVEHDQAAVVPQGVRKPVTGGHLEAELVPGFYRLDFRFEAVRWPAIVVELEAGVDTDVVDLLLEGISVTPPIPRENGLSAYELAVRAGYGGTLVQWLDSLKGPPGTPGSAGSARVYSFPRPGEPPASSWAVTHDLGRLPVVSLVMSDGAPVDAPTIVTATTVLVTWPYPVAGTMILS